MVSREFSDIAEPFMSEALSAQMLVNRSATEFTRLYYNNDAKTRGNIIEALSALPEAEIEKLAASTPVQQYTAFVQHAAKREGTAIFSSPTADDEYNAHRSNPINLLKGIFGNVAPVETQHHRSLIDARIADFVREECDGDPAIAKALTEQVDHLAEKKQLDQLKTLAGANRTEAYFTLNEMVLSHLDAQQALKIAAQENAARPAVTTPNGQKWEML